MSLFKVPIIFQIPSASFFASSILRCVSLSNSPNGRLKNSILILTFSISGFFVIVVELPILEKIFKEQLKFALLILNSSFFNVSFIIGDVLPTSVLKVSTLCTIDELPVQVAGPIKTVETALLVDLGV